MCESTDWPAEVTTLWARLSTHAFEHPDDDLDFTRRLAREQDWSLEYARGAIMEYRRFCLLCCVAGEHMTPSQEIDEVWHLHLTFTRDYWERFCPLVLGTPLHHGPTRGGPAEDRRYRAQYARTLAAYEHWFGPPPLAFWPGTRERFADPARWRRIDLHRHWVLPRPRLPVGRPGRRGLRWGVGLVLGAAVTASAALPLNPLDWNAGPFLSLYLSLAAAALVWSFGLRVHSFWRLRETGSGQADALDPYQLGFLAGGPTRAVDVGVTQLLSLGLAELQNTDSWWTLRLRLTAPAAGLPAPLRALGAAIERHSRPSEVVDNATEWLTPIRASLSARGLAISAAESWTVRKQATLPVLAVAAFGVANTSSESAAIARSASWSC